MDFLISDLQIVRMHKTFHIRKLEVQKDVSEPNMAKCPEQLTYVKWKMMDRIFNIVGHYSVETSSCISYFLLEPQAVMALSIFM